MRASVERRAGDRLPGALHDEQRRPMRYAGAMKSGVWNLGFGLVAVAAGATGQFKLLGTDSSTLLIVAGALVATLGVFQLWKNRGK
jgi:hypothetical protein